MAFYTPGKDREAERVTGCRSHHRKATTRQPAQGVQPRHQRDAQTQVKTKCLFMLLRLFLDRRGPPLLPNTVS